MKESQTLEADIPTARPAGPNPCPDWCAHTNCRGEHDTDCKTVAATGDDPETVSVNGAMFPVVSVRGTWGPEVGQPLALCLYIGGSRFDSEVYLRPAEAREVIEQMHAVLKQIDPGYDLS